MDRRFTKKDGVLFSLIGVLIILVLLSMYMVDRQWLALERMHRVLDEQSADIAALRRRLGGGVAADDLALDVESGAVATDNVGVVPTFSRALSAAKQPGYAQGDWFVKAFSSDLKTISPIISSDAYAADVQSYVLETLLKRNPDTLEWQGHIAKQWTVSDDGLTITFTLRDGVTFSDGKPLTAADVAFSYAFIMDERIAAPRLRAVLNKIESVEATDRLTVVFKYKEPYFNALALAGGLEVMPKHFYAPYLKTPEKFNQSKGLLLGSGPYRLADPKGWTPDNGLVELERNPRYWGDVQPTYKRILWKVIANDSARLTTFRNGELDSYNARPREYQQLLDDKALQARAQKFEYMSPTAGYSYIGWNQRKEGKPTVFADQRVRQAMTYLTDRERIIKEVMLGYAEVAISPFSPRSKQHAKALSARKYDAAKAKKLLKSAGFEDRNRDGILEDARGLPFEFELVYFQDSEDTKRIVLFLKDLYARAGIVMKPKPAEWSVMLDLIESQNFDAITLGWTSGVETDIFQMFHGDQIEKGGDNFVNYKSDRLDPLIDKARSTVDEAERMAVWQQAEHVIYDEQPYTFLMRKQTLALFDKRIRNLKISKLGLNSGRLPIETYVPKAEQRYTD